MCYINTVKESKHSVHREMHIAHNQKQTLNEPSGLLEDRDVSTVKSLSSATASAQLFA